MGYVENLKLNHWDTQIYVNKKKANKKKKHWHPLIFWQGVGAACIFHFQIFTTNSA